jgi:hypothetical protein
MALDKGSSLDWESSCTSQPNLEGRIGRSKGIPSNLWNVWWMRMLNQERSNRFEVTSILMPTVALHRRLPQYFLDRENGAAL